MKMKKLLLCAVAAQLLLIETKLCFIQMMN